MTVFAVPKHTFIGIGMWLALIMWFNVWFVIWPNQQKALNIDNKYPDLAAGGESRRRQDGDAVLAHQHAALDPDAGGDDGRADAFLMAPNARRGSPPRRRRSLARQPLRARAGARSAGGDLRAQPRNRPHRRCREQAGDRRHSLAWWREAIAEIYRRRGGARASRRGGPSEAVGTHALPRTLLDALIDARRADLEVAPFADWNALDAYLDATASGVMRLGLKTCEDRPPPEAFTLNAARAGAMWPRPARAHWVGTGRSVFPPGAAQEEASARAAAAYAAARGNAEHIHAGVSGCWLCRSDPSLSRGAQGRSHAALAHLAPD